MGSQSGWEEPSELNFPYMIDCLEGTRGEIYANYPYLTVTVLEIHRESCETVKEAKTRRDSVVISISSNTAKCSSV